MAAAPQERQAQFAHGRHAAGLWHTHPEARPRPSRLDRETTWKYLDALGGMQERYLMLILGNANDPPELVLCSAERRDTDMWIELVESSETSLGR